MFLSLIQGYDAEYDYKVGHIEDEGTYRKSEVPDVSTADALTVKDTVVVQVIDADIAEVAMHPIRVHINITLVASMMPFIIRGW